MSFSTKNPRSNANLKRGAIVLIALLSNIPVAAHHGLFEFDTTTVIQIEGEVVDFKLMDPHSLLFVDARNDDNTVTRWSIEGGAAHGIIKADLSIEFLQSRPPVQIKAYPGKNRDCSPRCRANGISFEFGSSQIN